MAQEARTMAYLHQQGYPVPTIEDLSDDGSELVMERIEGKSMVDAIAAAPWSIRRHARTLADLHGQLHEIAAPGFLPDAPVGTGDRIVHMDLHPLNVMIGATRAVVIDWTGASAGDPLVDVGLAWVLMAAGQIPERRLMAALLGWGRGLLVNGFVSRFDRTEVTAQLRSLVEWKVQDPHMSEAEVAGMWRVVEQAEARA